MEQEIRRRINPIREDEGLEPLAANDELAQVARAYSCRMAEEDFFAHVSPDGDDAADRVTAAGLDYSWVGENIARTTNIPDPIDTTIEGWMESEGHRENILKPDYSQTGVGVCQAGDTYLYTQLFFHPRG
jgi:uncharacterized protein YkwD